MWIVFEKLDLLLNERRLFKNCCELEILDGGSFSREEEGLSWEELQSFNRGDVFLGSGSRGEVD